MESKEKKIIFITLFITEKCLKIRNNFRHFSQAGFNKSLGLISLIRNSGHQVKVISPSLVNRKSFKFFPAFSEKSHDLELYHGSVWDIPGIHLLTSSLSICFWLYKNRRSFEKIYFYNYRPETALPAFFGHFILGKKIYLDYEDGYFQLKINPILKWIINILEKLGNRIISGATVVHPNLIKRLNTKNVQIILGIIDKNILEHFSNLAPKSTSSKIVMYAGTLDEIRGVDLFLDLAEKWIKVYEGDYQFWISGKGPLEKEVRAFQEKYPNKIKFFGIVPHDELLRLYQQVDAFISLQKPQNKFSEVSFPSKVFEFLSTGKKVIGKEFSLGKNSIEEIFFEIGEIIGGKEKEKIIDEFLSKWKVDEIKIFET